MQLVDSFVRSARTNVRQAVSRLDSWTLYAFNTARELRGPRG